MAAMGCGASSGSSGAYTVPDDGQQPTPYYKLVETPGGSVVKVQQPCRRCHLLLLNLTGILKSQWERRQRVPSDRQLRHASSGPGFHDRRPAAAGHARRLVGRPAGLAVGETVI